MITKDEIEEAADTLAEEYYRLPLKDTAVHEGFITGIRWYKEELWHSFFEEPEVDGKVLCQDINNEFILVEADEDWKQKVGIYEIQKWCYLNDLL